MERKFFGFLTSQGKRLGKLLSLISLQPLIQTLTREEDGRRTLLQVKNSKTRPSLAFLRDALLSLLQGGVELLL